MGRQDHGTTDDGTTGLQDDGRRNHGTTDYETF